MPMNRQDCYCHHHQYRIKNGTGAGVGGATGAAIRRAGGERTRMNKGGGTSEIRFDRENNTPVPALWEQPGGGMALIGIGQR